MNRRVLVEGLLAGVAAVLAVVTAVNAEWIEWLTGWDPDAGSGGLEWAIAGGFAVAALAAGLLARRDLRRWRTATS